MVRFKRNSLYGHCTGNSAWLCTFSPPINHIPITGCAWNGHCSASACWRNKPSSQGGGEPQQVQLMLHHPLTLKEQIPLLDAPGQRGTLWNVTLHRGPRGGVIGAAQRAAAQRQLCCDCSVWQCSPHISWECPDRTRKAASELLSPRFHSALFCGVVGCFIFLLVFKQQ